MQREVALIEGDGIGPEICEAVLYVLEQAGAEIRWVPVLAGEKAVARDDTPLPAATLETISRLGVALKGPLNTAIGREGGAAKGFRSVTVQLRKSLSLYANVRPVISMPGVRTRYENVDIVVIRENTEGLYSGIELEVVPGVVTALKVTTREACTRIAEYAFHYAAREGRKTVCAVHKANILKLSDGLALEAYREVAARHPGIRYEEKIVDAAAMMLVINPSAFDVILTENLYGDILSDLTAGLIGGLGLAGSANIGTNGAMFEAVHGSAPDIAGKGIANPSALLISACELLTHIGQREQAARVRKGLLRVFSEGAVRTPDLGGRASTMEFAKAIANTFHE